MSHPNPNPNPSPTRLGRQTRSGTQAGHFAPPPDVFSARPSEHTSAVSTKHAPSEHESGGVNVGADRSVPVVPPVVGDVPAVAVAAEEPRPWSPVTSENARTHRVMSSASNRPRDNNDDIFSVRSSSPPSVQRAQHEQSREHYLRQVNRYQALADSARPAAEIIEIRPVAPETPRPENPMGRSLMEQSVTTPATPATPEPVAGPSQHRDTGKGVDPREWGNLGFAQNLNEQDLQAQRDALNNYEEINRVVKDENHSMLPIPAFLINPTTPAMVHDISANPSAVVEQAQPANQSQSDRAKDKRITELEEIVRQLSVPREAPAPENQARAAADGHIANLVRRGNSRHVTVASAEPARTTPGRIAAGSTLDKAFRASVAPPDAPPPDPSDSSDSSSDGNRSDHDGDMSDAGRRSAAASRHRRMSLHHSSGRKPKMLLKPIPLTKYDGEMNATVFQKFNLDPETSSWDAVVHGAEHAEVLLKIDRSKGSSSGNKPTGSSPSQQTRGNGNGNSNRGPNIPTRGGTNVHGRNRGRGRGGRNSVNTGHDVNNPGRNVMRSSAVAVQNAGKESNKNSNANGERTMSQQKRNELLAKNACFVCEETGHMARDCPKSNMVVSKKKGKPPGMSTNAVSVASTSAVTQYETADVLESFLGSVALGDEVEGESYAEFLNSFDDSLLETQATHAGRHQPVGDLFAKNLMCALHFCQPYPGEEPVPEDNLFEERFMVIKLSPEQHYVSDLHHNTQTLIDSALLEDFEFQPGLWYARQRLEVMGLDPNDAPLEERYLLGLGDALLDGASTILDMAFGGFQRRPVREGPNGILLISDTIWGIATELPRALLRNEEFDLLAWYLSERGVSNDWTADLLPDVRTASHDWTYANHQWLDDISSEEASDSGSMPALESVSASSSDEELSVPMAEVPRIVIPGHSDEEFESRTWLWAHANEEHDRRLRSCVPRAHRIGDILGRSAASMLEFMQPYPGDELITWSDERRDTRRFRLERQADDYYVVFDSFHPETSTILPLEYLRVANFQLGLWYAHQIAHQLDMDVRLYYSELHSIEIAELLEAGVEQYFQEIRASLPSLGRISVEKMPRDLEDERPNTYLVTIPCDEHDLTVVILETALMNPRLDLVNWVLRHKQRWQSQIRHSREWLDSAEAEYFGSLFDGEFDSAADDGWTLLRRLGLGLKPPAWAWLDPAPAFEIPKPKPEPDMPAGLGPAPA
ncbi:hypothetical protein FB45DRAFT_1105783 [Roridomyces roridus]|uniref:CCHC-type domain-containing protein n=1 Tax=Roridomyces roridus TaxID=1738132 RepID=A0AAD7BCB9_9AGAR|nr:hypothetical protein FB45DRAFT_1105783 [Roridomyces roridus]